MGTIAAGRARNTTDTPSDEWRRATSIRRRILLPLVPLIALALLITAYAIYVSIQRELIAGLDRTLLAMARGVGAAVDVELEFEVEGPVALASEGPEATAFYVVRKSDGELSQSSVDALLTIAPSAAGETVCSPHGIEGTRYRVCTQTILREPDDDEEELAEWLAKKTPGSPFRIFCPSNFSSRSDT
jgi:hypothetical protein